MTGSRARLWRFRLAAAAATLVLMAGSMWMDLGRVQKIGGRSFAVGVGGGRGFFAATINDGEAPSRWIAQPFGFHADWWFSIERSPRAVYAGVPLWAPLAALAVLAWKTRPRRTRPGCCPACGYDRSGAAVCPECGRGAGDG